MTYLLDIGKKRQETLSHVTILMTFVFDFSENSDALHTYLSHSSTLNVGVLVVGVGGELCLLTR